MEEKTKVEEMATEKNVEQQEQTLFERLSSINVSDKVEQKGDLSYLSWTWAWSKIKKECPDADFVVRKFGEKQLPYVYDENTGYMVFTNVTINNQTYEMWLPVMDGNNKAMLNHSYTYKVKEYENGKATGKYIDKAVAPATMFDINKTIMRCLVKNIAMFGLGIYIYAGEDLPEGYEISKEEAEKTIMKFGKYKGLTLKEINEKDSKYLYWLIDNEGTSESLKNACSVLVKPITQEDVNLLAEFERLLLETDTDREKLYGHYKVGSNSEMTQEQLKDAIEVMKKKEGK